MAVLDNFSNEAPYIWLHMQISKFNVYCKQAFGGSSRNMDREGWTKISRYSGHNAFLYTKKGPTWSAEVSLNQPVTNSLLTKARKLLDHINWLELHIIVHDVLWVVKISLLIMTQWLYHKRELANKLPSDFNFFKCLSFLIQALRWEQVDSLTTQPV